ncbi:MAG: BatD family protein [Thermodesulfobacteriota bacterium]
MKNKNKNRFQLIWLLVLFSLLLFAGVPSLQAEVTAEASINVQSFPMDRAATLSISVKGVNSFQPQMPEIDGLRFHQRGQSTQVEIINGAYSASVTSVYLVEALREGKFTIPPITIHSNKGTVQTESLTFTVTAPHSTATARQPQAGSSSATRLRSGEAEKVAFMRVEPAKKQSYSGEVVPVRIKAYFREGIKANLNSLPQLAGEGFVLQQLAREPVQGRELVNNTRYTVLTWDSALSGIKEGEHKLSVEVEATLLLREQRQRGGRSRSMFSDPFFGDSFFDDFFGSYREKEVKVASPEMAMEVLSLPETGRPDSFSGAIGDFSLQVTADPLELEPGDPITLTMTVSGQGNFDRVQAPNLGEPEGWKSYTPSSEFLKDGVEGRGKKVFEQALVPKDPGLHEIPAVLFSYFDPDIGKYKTLSSSPISLSVHGQEETAKPGAAPEKEEEKDESLPAGGAKQVEAPMKGLAPLMLAPGDMDEEIVPLFGKRWFQFLVILLCFALLAGLTYKVRKTRYANNPRLQRDQAMQHLLALRMKELEQSLASGDGRTFLATCRQAIQEQLGLVWQMEGGAITLADLQQRLPADSLLPGIFKAAEESAYGGGELSGEQMEEFVDGLKRELEGLR